MLVGKTLANTWVTCKTTTTFALAFIREMLKRNVAERVRDFAIESEPQKITFQYVYQFNKAEINVFCQKFSPQTRF